MWYLFLIFGLMGIGAAAWNISAYNFVLENSEEEQRPAAIGTFAVMASLGVFTGALIGGAIAAHMPVIFSHQLLTLFLLSSLSRLVAVAVLLPGALSEKSLPGHASSPMHAWMARGTALRCGVAAFMHAIPI